MPTKSVPGGCVIGLAGLASWIYAAICGFILYRIWKVDQIAARAELFRHLCWHAGIAFVAGLLRRFHLGSLDLPSKRATSAKSCGLPEAPQNASA